MTIYFLQAGSEGAIKIGYTSGEPEARMAQLQTGCPAILKLIGHIPGSLSDEQKLHRKLWDYQISGEWFSCADAVSREIDQLLVERPFKPEAVIKKPPWYVDRIQTIGADLKFARMETEWIFAHRTIYALDQTLFEEVTDDSFHVYYTSREEMRQLILGLGRQNNRLIRRLQEMRRKGNKKEPGEIKKRFAEIRIMLTAVGCVFDHNFHHWSVPALDMSSDSVN